MRLRIGLVELAPDVSGGAATYGRAMRHILSEVCEELSFDLVRFVDDKNRDQISGVDGSVLSYRKWALTSKQKPVERILAKIRGQNGASQPDSLPQVLVRERVDLVWFLAPNRVIDQVRDTPFVMTVWDLAHREVQGFPEFNSGRGWAHRESWYRENIGRAFHVVTDSTHTGKSLEHIYGLYSQNWSPVGLPFPPATDIDFSLAEKFDVPYFYYPASFWPHKNHKVVIDALQKVRSQKSCLIFTGSDEGFEGRVRRYVEEVDLDDRVHFLGRIEDSQVQGLISKSVAIVMPSLLGPTNYPPLEALRLGKPALISSSHNFDGIHDSGLVTLDPLDSDSWAQAMDRVLLRTQDLSPSNELKISENSLAKDTVRAMLMRFAQLRSVILPGVDELR